MGKQRVVQSAVKMGLLGLMGMRIVIIDVQPSFAVCDEVNWTDTKMGAVGYGRCATT